MKDKMTIENMSWWHAINFGQFSTKGRLPNTAPPNYTVFGCYHFLKDIDLSTMACLDVGTMDGLMAFAMAEKGAGRVVATDIQDRPQFTAAREFLGYDGIEYWPKLSLSTTLEKAGKYQFDLILLAGVLYHLTGPLDGLAVCRHLLKENGLIIIETCCAPGQHPSLVLNMETDPPVVDEYSTYLVPTKPAVRGLMKMASFDVIGEAQLRGIQRATFMGVARKPSDLAGRSPLLQTAHNRNIRLRVPLGVLDVDELENGNVPVSSISYQGSEPNTEIDVYKFSTDIGVQPKWEPDTGG